MWSSNFLVEVVVKFVKFGVLLVIQRKMAREVSEILIGAFDAKKIIEKENAWFKFLR